MNPFDSSVHVRGIWSPFQLHSADQGGHLALLRPGREPFSYSQLTAMFLELQMVLAAAGLHNGEPIAVVQTDGACALVSLLGVARIGSACPMNPSLTASELEVDLAQLGAAAVIVDSERDAAALIAARCGLAVIAAESNAFSCSWRLIHRRTRPPAPTSKAQGDTLFFLHTSATTSRRKLVPLSVSNVSAMVENTLGVLKLTEGDRLLLLARPFHIQGALSVLAQLRVGGSVIAPETLAPPAVYKILLELKPTWYTCGPTMHRALLTEIARGGTLPNSLRFIRSAGAPLPSQLREALAVTLRVPILNVYGLSETGGVTSTSLDEEVPMGSVGRSMGPEIAVMGSGGTLLPSGEEGEIVVGGPVVMQGYWSDPIANSDAFCNGWFRTGDSGLVDSSGYLFLRGRLKEIINRGGEKVLPDEVDAVISQHPAVRDVATFAVSHPSLGEDVACAVVPETEQIPTLEELRRFAGKQLAPFKVPRQIFVRGEIPRGATGKPKRLQLREEYAKAVDPIDGSVTRREISAAVEDRRHILRIWTSFLGSGKISDDDDFFALGGDSLSATSMLVAVQTQFKLRFPLPAEQFIENPTVSRIVRMLVEADEVETAGENTGIAYPMRKEGRLGTLFLVPANDTKGFYLRRLVRHADGDWASYLVRPRELAPYRPLYSTEDAAQHVVRAIHRVQPEGPYFLGGYCQGGLVAFEAALMLERAGSAVSLVLFDTPLPGGASAVRQWRTYSTNARAKLEAATHRGGLEPMLKSARSISRKASWLALRRIRPILAWSWKLSFVPALCSWATRENFDFYRPGQGRMNILHFVAKDETSRMLAAARLRWKENTTGKVSCVEVSGDHHGLFHEGNFGPICQTMEAWLGEQARAEILARTL